MDSAPQDGSPVWAFLYDSGVRMVRWMNPAECAAYEGSSDVEDYDGCWVEALDCDDDWSPKWWAPLTALPVPPDAVKYRAAISAAVGPQTEREGSRDALKSGERTS